MMKFWPLAPVLLLVATAMSQPPLDSTIERLAKVDHFAFGGVGFAGTTSQGEKDYKLIFARSSALTDFERLLTIGNPQAKAYALVGIRTLNPKRYNEVAASFRGSNEKVATLAGCLEFTASLSSILKHIEDGPYFVGK